MFYRAPFREELLLDWLRPHRGFSVITTAIGQFDRGMEAGGHGALEPLIQQGELDAMLVAALFSRPGESERVFKARHIATLGELATKNHPFALHAMGVYYDQGELVEQDKQKAAEYFKRAAESQVAPSMHIYGVMLYYGTGGAPKDSERGLEMVKEAARHGVAEASEFLDYLQKNQ